MKKSFYLSVICALTLALCGCGETKIIQGSQPDGAGSESSSSGVQIKPDELPTVDEYIDKVVKEHVAKIEKPNMTEYEKVKAAFDYVLEIGYYADSPALDVWRWRTKADKTPTREEMRGLNMLLFGAETCEGYAAALNMLLEEMGVETRYMTGLTYLAQGGLGYHSWSQVKIGGVWYHIDPDLEDARSKSGTVNYKYFLRSDEFMKKSHYWGQRLINKDILADEQEEEISKYYMGEKCPEDYPSPADSYIPVTKDPNVPAIQTELKKELKEYEDKYGKLEYMDLGTEPPVFINYYLDKRGMGGIDQDMVTFAEIYQATHCIIRKAGTEHYDLSMLPEEKQYGFIVY